MPMEIGQYIDYNLDSTVFLEFGTIETVLRYQAREVVEGIVHDNSDRESFRVVRYLRNNENEDWRPSITFMVTPLSNTVEVVENNLRYVKLASPIRQDFSWKGNSYIDDFSTDLDLGYMGNWDYTYDSVGISQSVGALTFDNTLKVDQIDETLGHDPDIPGTLYAERNFSYEKYAKGIGLIERNFLHWEYQGGQPGRAPYYEGYGLKMTITGYGHN